MVVSDASVTKIVKLLVISPSVVPLATTIWYLLVVLVRTVLIPRTILLHWKVGMGTPVDEHEIMTGFGAVTLVAFWEASTETTGEITQRERKLVLLYTQHPNICHHMYNTHTCVCVHTNGRDKGK